MSGVAQGDAMPSSHRFCCKRDVAIRREVIIFTSLVRTWVRHGGSTRAALGHVDDVRCMNVGLTRAQRALWVLGHAGALAASPHWARLMEHARRTGRLVRHLSKQSVPEEAPRPVGGGGGARSPGRWRRGGGEVAGPQMRPLFLMEGMHRWSVGSRFTHAKQRRAMYVRQQPCA